MALRVRGHAALAFVCGAALCALAAGGAALARGPMMGPPILGQTGFSGGFFGWRKTRSYPRESYPGEFYPRESYAREETAPARPAPDRHRPRESAVSYGQPVCVRLCDGFFFPTASTAGGEAACAAQCPDAPTELYTMTSDNIDDAVSSTGAPYSKLPVANRYRTTLDSTCTCHRVIGASRVAQLLHDPTLHRGDVVMTAQGFRVYIGDGYGASGARDFVALSKARGLPAAERAQLLAMENSAAGSPPRAAPPLLNAHRPKGRVTVEDGAPRTRRSRR